MNRDRQGSDTERQYRSPTSFDPDCVRLPRPLVSRRSTGYAFFMRTFTAVIERDPDTGLFVGYVPGWPGAHTQGASVDELRQNLEEVVAMLLEDGEPRLEGEFIGTQTVKVA